MPTSEVAHDTVVGPDVTIHELVRIGRDFPDGPPVEIGAGSTVRSHSVVYRGTRLGARCQTGHGVLVREHCTIGDDTSIGSHTVVEHHVDIGTGARLHSNCFVPEYSVVEAGAWLGPGVVVTNARYPNRPDTKDHLEGVVIEEGAVVGAGVVLMPGVRIGAGSTVGAGSLVLDDVPAGSTVVGHPAHEIETSPRHA